MPGTLTTYKIFVASAGGLDEFRKDFRQIIEHYNTTEAYHRGYMFMPVGWEDTTTGHGRPQAKINEDLRQCDFALFMFRNRWGTPPDTGSTYTSGTEEEWAIANEMRAKCTMRDIQGCFFPFKPCDTQDEMDQRSKVEAFKQKLIDEKKIFFKSFSADSEFQDWFRSITSGWLRDIEKETKARAETKEQFLAREKSQAQTTPENAKSAFNLLRKQLFKLFENSQYLAAQGVVQALHEVADSPLAIAQALQFEGFIQSQLGQFQNALHLVNEVVRRFGDATEPALREQVAMAMLNKGITQGQLNQSEAAIATYDAVVRRFGDASEPALREPVARALVNKGVAQDHLNQSEAAIATYDELVRRFGDASEPALREPVAAAMLNKGATQGQLNQSEAAIATYDEVGRRFGDASEPALRELVAKALVNKGFTQGLLNQSEAEIATYDEVLRRFGDASEPALREPVARALVNKGNRQGQLNRSEAAIATYDVVVSRFGAASEPALRKQVAMAMFNKGNRQGNLNQSEAAIATYNEVVHRFGDATEPALREPVATAMLNKGITQGQLNQSEAAIATYDELVRRFGDASESALREPVARALVNKGIAQSQLNQSEAAIATYDEVVHRFGDASESALREPVARALVNKGIAQSQLNQSEAAIATYDEVVHRFGDASEPALLGQVTHALNASGFHRLLQAKCVGPLTPRGQNMLRTALENLNDAIARSAQPNGMFHGNRAYVHHLLGQTALAEVDFAAALRAPEHGGRSLYDATLEDLAMHPIAEDEGMRALVERAWAGYQQETGGDTTAA